MPSQHAPLPSAVNDEWYQEEVAWEAQMRARGVAAALSGNWKAGAAQYLATKHCQAYLEAACSEYQKSFGHATKYGHIWSLFHTEDVVRAVALDALLYVLCTGRDGASLRDISLMVGKRAELELFLTNPEFKGSWYFSELKQLAGGDAPVRDIRSRFMNRGFRHFGRYQPLQHGDVMVLGRYFVQLMELSGLIEIVKEFWDAGPHGRLVIRYSDSFLQFVSNWRETARRWRFQRLPMIAPPRPWTEHSEGGYYTLANRCHPCDISEFGELVSDQALQALNSLQGQPMRVDWAQLRLTQECWGIGREIGSLPTRTTLDRPTREECDGPREYWRKAFAYHADRRKLNSRIRTASVLSLAEEVMTKDIWCPLHFDHRGRMYPGGALNHNQPDHVRSLLSLPHGIPIRGNEEEFQFQMARAWGHEPRDWEGWRTFGWTHRDMARAVGTAPVEHLDVWAEAKEPWLFARLCRDWAHYLDGEHDHLTSVWCRLDQTCSGYGHVAALTGDESLAEWTNLLGDEPCDLYEGIRRQVTMTLLEGRVEDVKPEALDFCATHPPTREVVKALAMPLIYGKTSQTIWNEARAWYRAVIADVVTQEDGVRPGDCASVLSRVLIDSALKVCPGLRILSRWLRHVSGAYIDAGLRPTWTTPDGMRVMSYCRTLQGQQVCITIRGQRYRTSVFTDEGGLTLDRRRSGNKVCADFIHSMDGAFAREVARNWKPPLATVHDCFATDLASVAGLREHLLETWRGFYLDDHLARVHAEASAVLGRRIADPPRREGAEWLGDAGENPWLFS